MVKRVLVNLILAAASLFVWLPLLLIAGNALMSEGEMLERYGALFGMGNSPVKAAILPGVSHPCALLWNCFWTPPGFYVMFWNSRLQTGAVLGGQLLAALARSLGVCTVWIQGEGRLCFFLYIILMMQPFQVTMVPGYLVLKQMHLLNTHLAVVFPGMFSAFPVFVMAKFFESIPGPLVEAARLDGAGEFSIFARVGIPVGKPGIVSVMVLGFLENWNAIEQPMTYLKEKRLWPLSLYLPEITSDKAGVAWAASIIMMMLPVILFVMGAESLEQGIAASGIKE